ncbi:MAG: carboxypeptidase-like regulatory domain-containing protein [Bacteroidota bacterium]
MRNKITCIILFFGFGLYAQNHTIEGEINSESNENSFVNIINLNQKKGDISDIDGYFKIKVNLNDTLIFSAVQFEKIEVVVDEELLNHEFIIVDMKEKENILQEVVVSNIALTGNLADDAANNQPYIFDYYSAGLTPPKKPRTQAERRLFTATSSNVDYILNAIRGELKKLEKMREYETQETNKIQLMNSMHAAFFEEEFGIPQRFVEDFAYFCVEDDRLVSLLKSKKEFDLFQLLQSKSIAYKELRAYDLEKNDHK